MRALPIALLSLALLGSGCIVVPGRGYYAGRRAPEVEEDRCPPGHRWSDGRCHDKGKGHDPAKHDR